LGIIIPNNNKYEIELFFNNIINYIEKVDNVTDPEIKDEIIKRLSQDKPFNIPNSFLFLAKTIAIIEGICNQLDPEFNLFDYLEPYFQESIMESIDLQKMATSTFEIPSKINYISTSVGNIEQQRTEIDIKLNRYENLIKNNNYFIVLLMSLNNFNELDLNFEIILFISIFFIFNFQKKNRR
jgi:hypothetical protein